ncbi:Gfo/Idh/MocA family protein [Ruania alba]|uniref:Oxidoreductase family, NAD-binding Rossmann fold n=1 Tax=Ruania alba TaxID=648782 RepID=A0A1H5BJR6_9MICO|nr:Gfo/Idh/MocA family oxidoreductase [Ruania alba]SED54230.1 Oxidoreductase family, NAD-binding Rossmann fold [Ruania alba]
MTTRRRYAVAGTGTRSTMYLSSLTDAYAHVGELVAVCEPNPARAAYHGADLSFDVPRYEAADLERMIAEQRIDRVVVTSPDHSHADLVARSMRAGADVVVEKPLTTTAEGVRVITETMRETGRDLVMTFNYRYSPRNSELRRVIAGGEIGRVLSVHFEWALDTVHGADYFRRWHRQKDNSGGLLVHKSSHHFDLVNWWIGASPARVYATGGLKFYGPDGAGAAGAGERPAKGRDAVAGDPWAINMAADPKLKALYLDAEEHDGYVRDQDVFTPGITIEDNLGLTVDYANGAFLTYSLNAHAPWEGYRVTVNGTEGRAELDVVERGWVDNPNVVDPSATPDGAAGDQVRPTGERLVVQRHWEPAREVVIPMGAGSHGGGDAILLRDIFEPGTQDDPLGRASGVLDGVRAVSVGIAGNISLAEGRPVAVEELALGVDLAEQDLT